QVRSLTTERRGTSFLLRPPHVCLRKRLNLPRGTAPHEIERLLVGTGECEILYLAGRRDGAQVLPLRAIDLDAIAPGVVHPPLLVDCQTVGAAGDFVAKAGPDVTSRSGAVDLNVLGEVAAVRDRPVRLHVIG